MDATSPRWQAVTDSAFPWERDAMAFVRDRLPDHEPYRAWANFEFIADDGSINEVDLLALTPKGFYLVEIKSRPGVVEGDQGTWTWRGDGRRETVDNPLLLANRKAKKLIALLRRQPALRKKAASPFLEAHVFLSHEDVDCRLTEDLRGHVHRRDAGTGRNERPGIVAALTRHGAGAPPRARIDRPMAKAVSRAMQEAGIRPSQSARRVGDYRLDALLFEGPGYQDWTARHAAIDGERARVRIYAVPPAASDDERAALERAARREYQILRDVRHEGILAAKAYTEHVRGPALIFEHREGSRRFDHWLAERGARLDVDTRLHLLRQIAEAVHFAHAKRLVHRALSPQSVLVVDPEAAQPRVQVFNWQTGARAGDTGTSGPATVGASRLDAFVEEGTWVYMAPEAVTERGAASEQIDVFSLGAIAYHLFSGRPPAAGLAAMTERLRQEQGLQISSDLDGVCESLQLLVQYATHPAVTTRLASVGEFLKELEGVEEELTRPDEGSRPDPVEARPGDELGHGLVMKRRLGKGGTALALLVERDGREHVLKVALSPDHNDRLRAEADVLRRLRHQYIVELHDELAFRDGAGRERAGLLMARAGDRTLADRLRDEGRLHLELLERFGEDLLATIDWLEQKGIPHRDIKPDNLGTAKIGSQLHLVLFDFSLARTPAENVLAGTRHYLDPFLQTRRPPRWDTHAERFAAAVTLHQMAAGSLPRWGDGQSEPAVLDCEATIDADAFEPAVREDLTAFFRKALRRDYRRRFDNAEEMLRAWRQLFLAAARPETDTDPVGAPPFGGVEQARLDTLLAAMGLSARAMNAVERMGVRTVHDLLRFPLIQVNRMRGVGIQTRRELTELARRLAARFPEAAGAPKVPSAGDDADVPAEAGRESVDELRRLLLPAGRTAQSRRDAELAGALLGLSGGAPAAQSRRDAELAGALPGLSGDAPAAPGPSQSDVARALGGSSRSGSTPCPDWPSQSDVARALGVTPVAVSQTAARARRRWTKLGALTRLRHDIVELLEAHGNVMTRTELAAAILARRGSVQEEPLRSRYAGGCVRAAVEVERHLAAPRWIVRRLDGPARVLVARDAVDDRGESRIDGQKLADFAQRLGRTADELSAADPLLSPARALDALLAVAAPAGAAPLTPNRLLALAAAVSRNAALSSRLELYPRGMAADRALRLALGALAGAHALTPDEIRRRVAGRYPDAAPLPDRPELDALLRDAGSDLQWRSDAADGQGAYRSHLRRFVTIGSSTSYTRISGGAARVAEGKPGDWGDTDAFDERLRRALKSRAFLALTVSPRKLADAERVLASAFAIDARSADELLIRHMKAAAHEAGADWRTVLRADRGPRGSADWATLLRLVGHRALPRVRAELAAAPRAVLLTNLGLLARYDQMTFIDGLRDAAGGPDGPPGVWLLVPSDAQESRPMVDGAPVPVFTAAQWARIPSAWLAARRVA